jgi:cob(I)alamin adenosyltransferase
MSIVTKTGDQGTTALMYNRRVSKCDPRVEACGAVDELNAALGFARATARSQAERDCLLPLQRDLVVIMGELATAIEDRPRYNKDGFAPVRPELIQKVDALIQTLESEQGGFNGWAMPGDSLHSAALDLARTTCRRAERRVVALQEAAQLENPGIIAYLNRLSDLLWLLARRAEREP